MLERRLRGPIFAIAKIVETFFWRKVIEGDSDCVPECIDGSVCHFAQCVFELGEDLLDWIEVRAVGWQEANCYPRGFDGFPNAGTFMGTEIVHQHDFTGRQGRDEYLLDIGKEPRAIDGTVEDTRSIASVSSPATAGLMPVTTSPAVYGRCTRRAMIATIMATPRKPMV